MLVGTKHQEEFEDQLNPPPPPPMFENALFYQRHTERWNVPATEFQPQAPLKLANVWPHYKQAKTTNRAEWCLTFLRYMSCQMLVLVYWYNLHQPIQSLYQCNTFKPIYQGGRLCIRKKMSPLLPGLSLVLLTFHPPWRQTEFLTAQRKVRMKERSRKRKINVTENH